MMKKNSILRFCLKIIPIYSADSDYFHPSGGMAQSDTAVENIS